MNCFICEATEPAGLIGFLFEPLPEGPICDNCGAAAYKLSSLGADRITSSMVREARKLIEARR